MVQRCSNGVGFIVLEAEPQFNTGISLEIYDGGNPLNLLDVLPDSFQRKWTDPRKGTGAGEFKVFAENPKVKSNPNLLAAGNIVRCLLDRVPRFAFKIEKRRLVQIGEGDDSAVAWHITGRGALSLLEDGQIYPAGGLAGDPERPFTDATPGAVMATLLAENQARANSILQQITEGYTPTEDANNIPYETVMTLNERAGTDLLRVAERISELAADVYMTPTLELRIVNNRGVDKTVQTADTGPVVLQQGENILELERDEEAVIRNALLIETPGGFVERLEASSISQYRRREAYISLGNITDSSQIDRAAEAVFERSANPAEGITIKVLDDVEGRRPYVDFGVGDWVKAPDIAGVLERFRVNSLTISEDIAGNIDAIPELATITDDLEERLARWLKSMARGTMGGAAADVTEPNRAPAEVVEAVDAGIDTHEATYLHPDELSDLADVDVTGLADGDILTYDAGAGDWTPEALELDALADVDVSSSSPTNGQVLKYSTPLSKWIPGNESGGGGGSASSFLDAPKGSTDDPPDDEFDDGSGMSGVVNGLDAKWTAVKGASGTVALLRDPAPVTAIYDLATVPGTLLLQCGTSDEVSLRQDFTLADGDSLIVAVSTVLNAELGDNQKFSLTINDNDTAEDAGEFVRIMLEQDSGAWDIQGNSDSSTAGREINGAYHLGKVVFLRFIRTGLVYSSWFSADGTLWNHVYDDTHATQATNLWLTFTAPGTTTYAPMAMVHWLRKGTDDLDPWPWR